MIADEPPMTDTLPDIVNALAASPHFVQDGACFAARNSGLYVSRDGGQSWRSAYASLALDDALTTTAVAVSPDFTSDHTVFAGVNGGVLRSLDGGATWQTAMLPVPPPLVTTIAVSPDFAVDGVVFAGTLEDGVFRSADRGSTWAAWNFGLLDLNVLCVAVSPNFATDETLFAGTVSGLFRSANGGRAWREVDFPPDLAPVLSVALSSSGAGNSVVFVGTEGHGLFASHDNGRTWTRQGEDVVIGAVNGIVAAPQVGAQPAILALLSESLLVSRDAGASWAERQPGLNFVQGAACMAAPLGVDADAPVLVGLVDGGVLRL